MNDNLPQYLFHQGTNYHSYRYFGAHLTVVNGISGVIFRVFGGSAKSVSVVGDFNNWNQDKHVMSKVNTSGIFELFIKNIKMFDNYKFCITTKMGEKLLKSDPFAFHSQSDGDTASKVYNLDTFNWQDGEYLSNLKLKAPYQKPINIYEVHLSSWRRYPDGNPFSFKKIAKELISYVIKMGYTHIELMPVNEYPFEGSWGYQVTGYFAITSRFGTPHDFMYFVNECHKNNIGVIVDWVPAHFPKDQNGLHMFDGTFLFEHSDKMRREHQTWGTVTFDYGRTEVQSFLISSAMMLFDIYHVDGLRVDAVASMLYLDYDKQDGQWQKNSQGDNKNLEAMAFLQKLNVAIFERYSYALMIAEESTAWGGVTLPVYKGGLGFNYKWNMGWMNDVLSYMQTAPMFRQFCHNKLTFSLTYAFFENYILPISHDEVVHGKKSLLDKMPGTYQEKFANMRAFLGYMYAHPGKKLLFMGSEFGQFKEWAYKEGLEFFMLEYPMHKKLHNFVKSLNAIYKENAPLFEVDGSWQGFEWISVDEAHKNVLGFKRKSANGQEIIALLNFSGITQTGYKLGVDKGKYQVLLNSDSTKFGGSGAISKRIFTTVKHYSHGRDYAIPIDIPPLSCFYFVKYIKGTQND